MDYFINQYRIRFRFKQCEQAFRCRLCFIGIGALDTGNMDTLGSLLVTKTEGYTLESSQQPREGDTADFNEQETLRETLRADLDANQFGGKLSGIFTATIVSLHFLQSCSLNSFAYVKGRT